ncbi:hypothetical protein DERP_011862 [Dermatophagoides pteronyssinus]|uniref:Uncharacterized protein n=1 Tax=Dermatophagoides pteronyssinus TaxID=6956 RepID=A0ABQ8JR94_DERPT|nr:hypothetical protein DERP_011862 [Dermatophagoides pteronyssinus]
MIPPTRPLPPPTLSSLALIFEIDNGTSNQTTSIDHQNNQDQDSYTHLSNYNNNNKLQAHHQFNSQQQQQYETASSINTTTTTTATELDTNQQNNNKILDNLLPLSYQRIQQQHPFNHLYHHNHQRPQIYTNLNYNHQDNNDDNNQTDEQQQHYNTNDLAFTNNNNDDNNRQLNNNLI